MNVHENRQEDVLLRKSIREINRLRAELEKAKALSAGPIAIVGMSCRVPGGVVDAAGYWAVLEQGRDVIGPFPERWDAEALYDPDPDARGKSYTREGGFLRDVDRFDAGFFGISPREAVAMDPQHRLVLEVAWEALEQAGIRPGALHESSTGFYVGSMGSDYGPGRADLESLDGYFATGLSSSVLAGRVSYALGLQGPALTVDTACSSSLVALHLACVGLRQGECDLALAGGVQVMSTPATFVEFSRLRGMAPDGRCKSFSAKADGAGWSEGCGMLVLRRLSDAERDGDRVLAVVRGSAVNQDGRSQGLTAPNGPSQQRVIRRALAVSGLEPNDIDAVEAHGTGTRLGDPIEAGALAQVFGPPRRAGEPLHLGSSKSNLGHTQAAAGVLGVMKVVLALQHEVLPRTLHAETASEHIEWDGSGLSLLQEARPWPRRAERPRRAGVSGFGVSGTNAHAIVEEAPERAQGARPEAAVRMGVPLLVSGRDEAALRAQARRWSEWLAAHPDAAWADVVRTAALHRTHFERRAAVFVEDMGQAVQALTALAEGGRHAAVTAGKASSGGNVGSLAMLFTGQGSQRAGMGRGLYGRAGFEVFSAAFDAAAAACDVHLDRPLRQVMWPQDAAGGSSALLDQTRYTQPALFALEVALFRQWEGWGVRPQIVLGHSIGELVCAHVAGVLSLADAAALVCARGRLMQELARPGGRMASLEASEAETRAALGELPAALRGELDIAGLNTPEQTVISGGAEAVEAVAGRFEAKGRRVARLTVSHAFHSAHMDGMLEAFGKVAERIAYGAPTLTVISNVTGKPADVGRGELVSADYWVRQIRQAVRFADGVRSAVQAGAKVLVECGPQGVLGALSAACLPAADNRHDDVDGVAILASLRKGDEARALLAAAGGLHVRGQAVDWDALLAGTGSGRVDLPTYPFQRQPYWWEPKPATSLPSRRLLGQPVEIAGARQDVLVWDVDTDSSRRRYLGEHVVLGRTIWPASAQIELALEAARAGLGAERCEIEEIELVRTLYAEDPAAQRVQVQLEHRPDGGAWLRVYARATPAGTADWQLHTRARVCLPRPAPAEGAVATGSETTVLVAPAPLVERAVSPRARAPLEFSLMFFAAMEEDSPTDRYGLVLEAARYGDAAGFGAVWVPERHFTHMGSLFPNPSVLHAALARETRRIGLRAGSVVLPLHHPIRVAEEWAMVDNLSGGRVGISLAPGWNPTDFALASGHYDDRYRDLYAGVGRLRELWRAQPVTVDGVPGGATQLRIYPTPVQRELPLWITAARNPESFRQSGALGTNVLTHLLDQDVDALAEKIAIYRAARAEHGHDPDAGRVTLMCHTFLADDLETVRKLARKPFCDYLKASKQLAPALAFSRGENVDVAALSDANLQALVEFAYERFEGTRALLGTPQGCLEMTMRLRAAGVDEIACLLDFGPGRAAILDNLPQLEALRDLHASACARETSAPETGVSLAHAALARPAPVPSSDAAAPMDLATMRQGCREQVSPADFYRDLAAQGVALSGSLCSLRELAIGDGRAVSRLAGQARGDGPHEVGAALVDGCMQTALAALLYRPGASKRDGIFVPTRVGRVRLHRPAGDWPQGDVHAFAQIGPSSTASLIGSVTALDADGCPLLSIDDVVVDRVEADGRNDELAGWGYEARWRPDPAPTTDGRPQGPWAADGWVVLADTGGVAEAWLARATGRPQCVRRFDEQNAVRGADSFTWLEALDLANCPGILCLWPLDTPSIASADGAAVLGVQQRGVATVVALAQIVARCAGPRPRIWVATRAAQAVTAADAVAGLDHAGVWGLAAAVAREHPRAWGGIIDLDPEMTPDMAAAGLDRLLRPGRGEDQVAVRGGQRYVRRLARAPLPPARDQLRVSGDGTYLIAGGRGGLGLAVARWLVERGARHLLLLGRSAPDADDARIAELGARGATVHYRTVDVGDAAELRRLLRDWQASDSPAIRGVVHAAGVFQDQLLEAITPDDLDSGLRAKIVGAYTLDRAFGELPLDFFLLFSSFSGVVPPPGQAVYAAACAFVDGLAEQRRAAGRTALSIAWGAWSEVGFAATEYGRRAHARLEDAGMKRITPGQGVRILERLLGGDPPARVGILPFDLAALVRNDELLARMPVMRDLLGGTQQSVSATTFLAGLNDRDLDDQRRLVLDAMRGLVAEVLKQRLEQVDVDAPLIDLGLASLAALQLKNRIARDMGLEMSLADALRGATIATLAERLLTELRIDRLRAAEPPVGTVGDKEGLREEFVL